MRLIVRLFGLCIIWLALGSSPVYAAELRECTDVKRLIRAKSVKEKLSRVKKEIKSQIRARDRQGNEYEGQADTACLIGLYMLAGHDKNNALDAKSALDRYNKMEIFLQEYTKNRSSDLIKDVLNYSKEATPQERRDHYQKAIFFLYTLIEETTGITDKQVVENYPYRVIKDKVWCGAPSELRRRIDKKTAKIKSTAETEVNWAFLGKSEYLDIEREAKRYYHPKYHELCKAEQRVTRESVERLYHSYREKAERLTRSLWRSKLNGNRPAIDGQWGAIKWLGLQCGRGPNAIESGLSRRVTQVADSLLKNSWYEKQARVAYQSSDDLNQELKKLGRPNCFKYADAVKRDLQNRLKRAQVKHLKEIKIELEPYKTSFFSIPNPRAEERLGLHRDYVVQLLPSVRSECLIPPKNMMNYRNSIHELVNGLEGNEPLEVLLIAYKKSVGDNERTFRHWAENCGIKSGRRLDGLIRSSREQVEKRMEQKIVDLWALEQPEQVVISTLKLLTSDCNLFRGGRLCDTLPLEASVQELVRFLKSPKDAQLGRERLAEFRDKYHRIWSSFTGYKQRSTFKKRKNDITKKIQKNDQFVADYWVKLFQNCRSIEMEQKLESDLPGSINKACSRPRHSEIAALEQFCRLQKLAGLGGRSFETEESESHDGGRVFWITDESVRVAEARFDSLEVNIGGEATDEGQSSDGVKERLTTPTNLRNSHSRRDNVRLMGRVTQVMKRAGYRDVETFSTDLKQFDPPVIQRILTDRLDKCSIHPKKMIMSRVRDPWIPFNYFYKLVGHMKYSLEPHSERWTKYDAVYRRMMVNKNKSSSSLRIADTYSRGSQSSTTMPTTGSEPCMEVLGEAGSDGQVLKVYRLIDKVEGSKPNNERWVKVRSPLLVGSDSVAVYALKRSGGDGKTLDCLLGGTPFYFVPVPGYEYEFLIRRTTGEEGSCYKRHLARNSESAFPEWHLPYGREECTTAPTLKFNTAKASVATSAQSSASGNVWCVGDKLRYIGAMDCTKRGGTAYPTKEAADQHQSKEKRKGKTAAGAKDPSVTESNVGGKQNCTTLIHTKIQLHADTHLLGESEIKEPYNPVISITQMAQDASGDFAYLCHKPNPNTKCSTKVNREKKFRVGGTLELGGDTFEVTVIDRKKNILELQPISFSKQWAKAINNGSEKSFAIRTAQTIFTVRSKCNSS